MSLSANSNEEDNYTEEEDNEEDDHSYTYGVGEDWDGDDNGCDMDLTEGELEDIYCEEDSFASRLESGPGGVKYIETENELLGFLDACVEELVEVSGESYGVSLALLRAYKWDKDEVIRRFLNDTSSCPGMIRCNFLRRYLFLKR